MGILAVIVAALGGFFTGAAIYMSPLSSRWMVAAGVELDENGRPVGAMSPKPFVVSGIAMLLTAGMMRHVFAMTGVDGAGAGFVSGLGLGLFMIAPWLVMNYAYAKRPRDLALIDGLYAVLGPAVIGLILGLF